LHRVPKKIMPDRGTQYTLMFWERLHETLDTKLRFKSAYHPQIDGQTERVNQILEDMLRACCHTPFPDRGNEASIRVPRMFHSHV
jgi:hypothetical protein